MEWTKHQTFLILMVIIAQEWLFAEGANIQF